MIAAAAATNPRNINLTWVGNWVLVVAYSLASHPSSDSTKTEGIVKIINDMNPTKGDLVSSMDKLTTIWITVGPGSAQQSYFISLNWDGLTQFFYLTNTWYKY